VTPEERLYQAVKKLEEKGVLFAVAGGHAARCYRNDLRATKDADIAIGEIPEAAEFAKIFVTDIGLKPRIARKAELDGGPLFAIKKKSTPALIICGEKEGDAGLDFILPKMSWVPEAVKRAQSNLLDLGFGLVPVLTAEDLIIAKLAALSGKSSRDKDKDDLRVIFLNQKNIDFDYLYKQMKALKVSVSLAAKECVPEKLVEVSDRIKQAKKREGRLR